MARDPLLLEILQTLRGQNDTMAQVRVDMATMAANLLALANLPARVEALEKYQLRQKSMVEGGWWVWTKVIGISSALAGFIGWGLNFLFHRG